MQRLLAITSSIFILSACSSMDGMVQHHHTNYDKLAKIAKQQDAQYALLLTRDAKLVVVNVNTGRMLQSEDEQKASHEKMDNNTTKNDTKTVSDRPPLSDVEFAELKRRFDHTIAVDVTRGSECINFTWTPPGLQFRDCSPPSPKWW